MPFLEEGHNSHAFLGKAALHREGNFKEKGAALSYWPPTLTEPREQEDWPVKGIWVGHQ